MTLGGLKQGVTRSTWRTPTRRSRTGGSASAARSARPNDGPVGIREVDARTTATRCIDATTIDAHQARAPEPASRRQTTRAMQTGVVSSGTGKRAAIGGVRRGQDRHDRELRRRLVRRLHRQA